MTPKHIQHLYWRAAFGIAPDELHLVWDKSKIEIVRELFNASQNYEPLDIGLESLIPEGSLTMMSKRSEIKKILELSKEKLRELNHAWVERLLSNTASLRERMVLFWSNHFVCRDNNVLFVQQYNNTLRKHALGNFGDFVKAISREPAMLKYLNNKQNVKRKPNENFARELMELFTLGPGHYSEEDIKQSARAFTGYFHNLQGEFFIRRFQQDRGRKRFLGQSGYFDGDDVIDIILGEKQCAKFICEKIYAYFVNENINQTHVEKMVEVFYPNYEIGELMRYIFLSEWFYAPENIGTKIKSPIEFLVGINTLVPIKFNETKQLLAFEALMGQPLLNPPNVSGWKGGRNWINCNTLLFRLKLPSLILNEGKVFRANGKQFMDPVSRQMKSGKQNKYKVDSDHRTFEKRFARVPLRNMHRHVLNCEPADGTKAFINELGKPSKFDYCIQLMSLPEYQMC